MLPRRKFIHERGDYTTAGIALGALVGAAVDVLLTNATIGVGAAAGASAGFVIGALLDVWADHPHTWDRRHRPPAGLA